MAGTPSYLKRRRLGWYVQLAVPVALQAAVGAKVLTRSLQTRDLAEARRRSHAVVAELQHRIADAARLANVTAHPLIATAEHLRAAEAAGIATAADTEAALSAALDRRLDELAKRNGRDPEGNPNMTAGELGAIRRAHDIAAGRPDESLSTLLANYLRELESDAVLTVATVDAKRVHLGAFVAWFGGDRSWREVRRRAAVDYLAHLKTKGSGKDGKGPPLSRASIVKELSALRVFFASIINKEDADARPANPFVDLKLPKGKRGKDAAHRPWTPAELSTFLHAVPSNDPLWTLGVLGAYSGARLEELASLRVDAVQGDSFVIEEGKRQASVRRVPVHPVVAPLVARLVATSGDGYVIPGLLTSGKDGKRGKLLGKRFAYALRAAGVTDPRVVFHSLRNTVVTQLLSRGVALERMQLIVGHETDRGLGNSLPYVDRDSVQDVENRKALSVVSYGEDLDAYVRNTGAAVTVETKARRRPKRVRPS